MFVRVSVFGWVWLQEAVVHSGCRVGKRGRGLIRGGGVSSARRARSHGCEVRWWRAAAGFMCPLRCGWGCETARKKHPSAVRFTSFTKSIVCLTVYFPKWTSAPESTSTVHAIALYRRTEAKPQQHYQQTLFKNDIKLSFIPESEWNPFELQKHV